MHARVISLKMKALGKDKRKTAQPSILSFFRAPSSLECKTTDVSAPPTASQSALPCPTDKAATGSARRQHSQARSRQRTADSKAGDDGDSVVDSDSVGRKKLRSSGPCGGADEAAADGVLSDGHEAAALSLTSSMQELLEVAQRQANGVEGEAGKAGQGDGGETALSMEDVEGRGRRLRLSGLDDKVGATALISITEPVTVTCAREAVSSGGSAGEEGRGKSEEVTKESEDEDDSHDDGEDERDDGLTELERYRLEQIRQNEEFLASLGLATLKASSLQQAEEGAKKKPKRKRTPQAFDSVRSGPVRRSTRNRGGPVSYVGEGTGVDDPKVERVEEQEEVEVDYDDSTVLKYVCGPDTACASSASYDGEADNHDDRRLRGFTCSTAVDDEGSVEGRLHDPTLSAVYSMHVRGRLLAAAGKQGRISIFRAPCMGRSSGGGEDEQQSQGLLNGTGLLMSFRGHGGWVADVRWLTGTSEQPRNSTIRLISGGNDGVLKLWDVSKVAGGTPKTLASMRVHSKGVFSMDVAQSSTSTGAADGGDSCGSNSSSSGPTLVATGSKDATSALLQVTAADIQEVARIEGVMSSVIKCVRFGPRSSGRLLAMSGDDADVKVVDVRTRAENVSITSAHARTVHSVRWHPTEEHSIITAGFDPHVKLWDLRKPDCPVRTYFGHVSSLVAKQSSIHHPEFYGNGRYILTSGEWSERLSIYETDTGVAVSRGKLWREISQVVALGGSMAPIVVADRHGVITTLKPFLGSA